MSPARVRGAAGAAQAEQAAGAAERDPAAGAAFFAKEIGPLQMYPLVLDLAAGGMPLAVTSTTCATLTKTWLIEDGIPEIAQARRLGHRLGGVRGIYSRVTEPMINDLIDALQRRWKNTRPDGPESRVRRLRPVA